MNICQYKDSLGIPNEGVHSISVFGIAIVDVIFTLIGAYILNKYFNIGLIVMFIFLLIIAEFLHYIFCVETRLILAVKSIF